jgi:metal-responsive CopG/Arc/MetJ family transcriptional regulator
MKVAISLPDPVFAAAERLASHMGKSRSQLYAEAVARYVEVNQASVVTEQLNAVYASQPAQLDPALQAAQFQVLSREAW